MKKNEPKLTVCPSPARQDYKPDLAWRLAQQRAERDQPPLFSLASNVPSHRVGEGLK